MATACPDQVKEEDRRLVSLAFGLLPRIQADNAYPPLDEDGPRTVLSKVQRAAPAAVQSCLDRYGLRCKALSLPEDSLAFARTIADAIPKRTAAPRFGVSPPVSERPHVAH